MKYLFLLLMLCMTPLGWGAVPTTVNQSSFTLTNDTAYIAASFLDAVIVGAASAGGTLVIYNSTWTTSTIISSITLSAREAHFDNLAVKGLYYVVTANSGGVTIVYKK